MSTSEFPKCVLSAINFKGGTGKTTVAIAIAEGLCHLLGRRVVVVDCDFQCSASIALLGRRALNELIERNATLDCQLHSQITEEKAVSLAAVAAKSRHSVKEACELMYIVPGNPDMPRREREILATYLAHCDIHTAYERAARRVGDLLRSLLEEFDIVLIDCPSGLTLFSEAAIRAADGLIVPTLPNEISLAAIDHLRSEIARARPERSLEELLVGTVVSKLRQRGGSDHYRDQTRTIERLLDRVAGGFQILKPYLPYCRELEAATWRDDEPGDTSFRARYGHSSLKIEQLAHECADRCTALMARQAA
jgi:cellulose biosynthesis protein BcsQ